MTLGEWMLLCLSRKPGEPDLEAGTNEWTLENALEPLKRKFPDFLGTIAGRKILDFGSGAGWQSAAMAREGAAKVIGLEINHSTLNRARALAERLAIPEATLVFVAEVPPGDQGTFDVVLSQNSMEHFEDPAAILDAIELALRPGGMALITFGPPWYAPYGSHMHFFTNVPWVNVLFSEATVMRVRSRFRDDGAKRYEDVESGLNRMSISKFERLVEGCGLRADFVRYDCVKGMNFLGRIPLLRELAINDVTCALLKD